MPKYGIPSKRDYFKIIMPKLKEIENMVAYGYSIKEISDVLGVNTKTYYKWKSQYSELEIIHSSGKTKNIAKLKKSALQEALGYEYKERHVEEIKDVVTGEVTWRKTKTITKYARSNTNVLVFLLCNWAPDEFKRTDQEEILKTLQVFMSKEVKEVYGD